MPMARRSATIERVRHQAQRFFHFHSTLSPVIVSSMSLPGEMSLAGDVAGEDVMDAGTANPDAVDARPFIASCAGTGSHR
jgi:hypothetical protein